MVARELIADIIPPAKTSDSVQKVLDTMAEFRVSHLPVVEDNHYLGIVSDDDLIEVQDFTTPLADVPLTLNKACIGLDQHIYDVIRLFYERKLSLIPVLDEHKFYMGVISVNSIVEHMATITAVKEPGGIIVLEISNRNNSLAHIAQIVESNNAQILSSYVNSFADSTKLEVTLKINRTDISAIVAAFVRYDYIVLSKFNDARTDDSINGRYDQLMNYLSF